MNNCRGFTLIELLVVIGVVSVLVMGLAFQFTGWQGGYSIESEMKQLHINLMNARAMALQRSRHQFVILKSPTLYRLYDDTNPAPDGDETLQEPSDRRVLERTLNASHPITWNSFAVGTIIDFNQRGLSNIDTTICDNHPPPSALLPDLNPDNDCIIITATRINLGKLTNHIHAGGACDAANCVIR